MTRTVFPFDTLMLQSRIGIGASYATQTDFFFLKQDPPFKLIEYFLHNFPKFLSISEIKIWEIMPSGAPCNSFDNLHMPKLLLSNLSSQKDLFRDM